MLVYLTFFQKWREHVTEQKNAVFHEEMLKKENLLVNYISGAEDYKKCIQVLDMKGMELYSDISCQRVFCRYTFGR